MVGFTNNRRAGDERGGFALGKNTLIYNKFPRSAWFDGEVTIRNRQVRTDFFQEIAFFLVRPARGQKGR